MNTMNIRKLTLNKISSFNLISTFNHEKSLTKKKHNLKKKDHNEKCHVECATEIIFYLLILNNKVIIGIIVSVVRSPIIILSNSRLIRLILTITIRVINSENK